MTITWQRLQPKSCDFADSHKKAGLSVVLDRQTSYTFYTLINWAFYTLHNAYALLCVGCFCYCCCLVTFCTLVYFMWVFVLSQFPSVCTRLKAVLVWGSYSFEARTRLTPQLAWSQHSLILIRTKGHRAPIGELIIIRLLFYSYYLAPKRSQFTIRRRCIMWNIG